VTNGECRFNDVDINEWYAPYIITAEKYGIINGVDESTFGVGEKVSRQDMAVIIARAVKTLNKTIKTQDKNIELSDMENVAEYAKESVELLIKSGVINGINGEFKAYSNATKEECAKMIYMILENIK
ncbi:MAG: S-layer homology domain-containing protein, partial [Oscillospiraceae bacterium]